MPSLTTIDREKAETRADLATLLADADVRRVSGGVFRHPVSGMMTLPQVIGFLSVHLRHHGYQLERLARASRHL